MIQLDTNFLIRGLVPGSEQDEELRQWLKAGTRLGISAIAWAEFLCGPVTGDDAELAKRVVTDRLPFSEEDAVMAAELFNRSGRKRGTLADCMIAAVAVRAEAPLATVNISDFERFTPHGLELASSHTSL